MKLGAFLIVAQLGGPGERHVEIEDLTGLSRRQPVMAACLSLFLLSLLGLPVTAGFLGKFYVFSAALNSNLIWLAIGIVPLARAWVRLSARHHRPSPAADNDAR